MSAHHTGSVATADDARRLRLRHMLMLALAFETLILGARGAERYSPPGIAVEETGASGHVIT